MSADCCSSQPNLTNVVIGAAQVLDLHTGHPWLGVTDMVVTEHALQVYPMTTVLMWHWLGNGIAVALLQTLLLYTIPHSTLE